VGQFDSASAILGLNDFFSNVAELAVLILRLDDEDSECRVGPAAHHGHDDAFGLLDGGPVFHRRMKAFDFVDQFNDAGVLEDTGCFQALGPLPADGSATDFRSSPKSIGLLAAASRR
jgi:hypothetical protein